MTDPSHPTNYQGLFSCLGYHASSLLSDARHRSRDQCRDPSRRIATGGQSRPVAPQFSPSGRQRAVPSTDVVQPAWAFPSPTRDRGNVGIDDTPFVPATPEIPRNVSFPGHGDLNSSLLAAPGIPPLGYPTAYPTITDAPDAYSHAIPSENASIPSQTHQSLPHIQGTHPKNASESNTQASLPGQAPGPHVAENSIASVVDVSHIGAVFDMSEPNVGNQPHPQLSHSLDVDFTTLYPAGFDSTGLSCDSATFNFDSPVLSIRPGSTSRLQGENPVALLPAEDSSNWHGTGNVGISPSGTTLAQQFSGNQWDLVSFHPTPTDSSGTLSAQTGSPNPPLLYSFVDGGSSPDEARMVQHSGDNLWQLVPVHPYSTANSSRTLSARTRSPIPLTPNAAATHLTGQPRTAIPALVSTPPSLKTHPPSKKNKISELEIVLYGEEEPIRKQVKRDIDLSSSKVSTQTLRSSDRDEDVLSRRLHFLGLPTNRPPW